MVTLVSVHGEMSGTGTAFVAGLKRSHLYAFLAWEACAIGGHLILLASFASHNWDKGDLTLLLYVAGLGFLVVFPIALAVPRFGKVGGAVIGMLIGLWPSAAALAYVFVRRPGFEESAGTFAVALMFAGPSAVGGALAGIICSRKRVPLALERPAQISPPLRPKSA